jgi:ubiquinone/menaquinone biosynthesis C-methylase UbiE
MEPIYWILLIFILLVLAILAFGAPRANVPRRPSLEGLDDPEVARAFDFVSRLPQFRLLRRMVLREILGHHPTGTLVDVGCGPGYLVFLIAQKCPSLQVIGVDISSEMVETAARQALSLDLGKRVTFRLGDSQQLPFEDGELDFVVSSLSLHHWSQPEQALQEIQRVLKPGGQFLIFDLRRDAPRLFYGLLRFAQRVVLPDALRRVDEPVGSALASYTPAEVEALFRKTSFREWKVKSGFAWMFVSGRV